MNTEVEKGLVHLAEVGLDHGGDASTGTGWYGITRVDQDARDWLISEGYDVEADEPADGWYMVTVNSDGVIYTMPATGTVAERWFEAVNLADRMENLDFDTAEAYQLCQNIEHLYALSGRAADVEDLEALVGWDLADREVNPDRVDWEVLFHLTRQEG